MSLDPQHRAKKTLKKNLKKESGGTTDKATKE